MADLCLEGLSKSFGETRIIRNVNLEISHGEFVVFVGPSGCGKSTLLRLITGLESVTEGRVLIGGEDVTHLKPSKREVAMVFQSYALFPHMTVAENIGFGMRLAKVPKEEILRRVMETARILQVDDLLDRKPRQLSGGQRQRVAIGRSIIRDPKVFLFDEPLSNLDAALRVMMRLEITRLHKRLGATMIFVTHDQTEAMTLADRIVVIKNGRIEQTGSPMDLYTNPANRFVAGFIGSPAMNFIGGDLVAGPEGCNFRSGSSLINLGHMNGLNCTGKVTIGIRPEHTSIVGTDEADIDAVVEIVEELGPELLAYLQTDLGNEPLTLRLAADASLVPGQRVGLRFQRDYVHLFRDDGGRLVVE